MNGRVQYSCSVKNTILEIQKSDGGNAKCEGDKKYNNYSTPNPSVSLPK
jgi:hypothetical protein